MRIRFWGVRGTIPTPGKETIKYGGNTACIDILTSDQHVIIIDAGSGIRLLGQALAREHPRRVVGSILISHTHWDHIQGFPFFAPVFGRNNRFVLIGQQRVDKHLEEVLAGQFIEPYLPFAYKTLPADLLVKEIEDGETIVVGEGTTVTAKRLNHPGGCLGFRIADRGAVFAYCSDTGHPDGALAQSVLDLADGADLLLHDAHFASPGEARRYASWGHSCWQDAVHAARQARVGALGLFHYAPDLTDDDLELIKEAARRTFPRTFLAREGMTVELPLQGDLPE